MELARSPPPPNSERQRSTFMVSQKRPRTVKVARLSISPAGGGELEYLANLHAAGIQARICSQQGRQGDTVPSGDGGRGLTRTDGVRPGHFARRFGQWIGLSSP